MIAELRARHRWMWLALVLVLPATIAVAWWVHRPAGVMEQIPPELRRDAKP